MSLERLKAAADALGDSPEGQFLAAALRRMAAGLDTDQALELRGPAAIRRRDQFIAQAAALTCTGSPWKAAGILAERIGQRHRRRCLDPIDKLLEAANDCASVPKSRRRIYSILASD